MKADASNIEKVKMLVMKHLTREADKDLVTEYLAGVVSGGMKASGVYRTGVAAENSVEDK